jgi:hypothetical protein
MTRPPRRRLLQALPYKRSLLSSTLHHASCKATKVQTCDDGCDKEHDNESKSESDNDDEPTKDELMTC